MFLLITTRLMTSEDIYPRIPIVVANAVFLKIVLIQNAKVTNNIYFGK